MRSTSIPLPTPCTPSMHQLNKPWLILLHHLYRLWRHLNQLCNIIQPNFIKRVISFLSLQNTILAMRLPLTSCRYFICESTYSLHKYRNLYPQLGREILAPHFYIKSFQYTCAWYHIHLLSNWPYQYHPY